MRRIVPMQTTLATMAMMGTLPPMPGAAKVVTAGCPGGGDWIDKAKRDALRCLPGQPGAPGCAPCGTGGAPMQPYNPNNLPPGTVVTLPNGTPYVIGQQQPNQPPQGHMDDDCDSALREVSIGAQWTTGALVAGDAWVVNITVGARFKPLLLTIDPTPAAAVRVTGIVYGVTNMMIGGTIPGTNFSSGNNQGGYRLKGPWIYPGQTIQVSGVATAAVAANLLVVGSFGLTDAPSGF